MERSAESELSALLGPIDEVESAGGGRNGRLYRVRQGSKRLAAKRFFRVQAHGRNFVQAEAQALTFLDARTEPQVPRLVDADATTGWLVSEWIDGTPANPSPSPAADLDEAVAFIGRLFQYSRCRGATELPEASEACVSGAAVVDSVECRLERLRAVAAEYADLDSFLAVDLEPTWAVVAARFRDSAGATFAEGLCREQMMLSPSDFGLHNALRTNRGLVFLDFEHFGWDDPAKLVCDVVLHPAMGLSPELGECFLAGMEAVTADGDLRRRVRALMPVLGVKWCTILLNEFVRADLQRRQFALGESSPAHLRAAQLNKARRMLERTRSGESETLEVRST
jgi:hypothetical protein